MKNLSQEENAAIQSNTWSTVLSFLCMELLGEEIFRFYQKHHFGNHPIKDDETAFDVELLPFEKRFYDLVDAAMIYLKENDYRLPRGQGDEKWNIQRPERNVLGGC